MIDLARTMVVVFAVVQAARHRFAVGIASATAIFVGSFVVRIVGYVALRDYTINGEYGLTFVYVGPTAVPLFGRFWFPLAAQVALADAAAPAGLRVLRRGGSHGSIYCPCFAPP